MPRAWVSKRDARRGIGCEPGAGLFEVSAMAARISSGRYRRYFLGDFPLNWHALVSTLR